SQVEEMGVTIQTGVAVTDRMIEEENPEVVILATGGERILPQIDGIDHAMVCDAWQMLGGDVPARENVLIIGGGLIGMEAADFLLDKGSTVTLVEALEVSPVVRFTAHGYWLHKRFRDKGGRLLLNTTAESIEEGSVTAVCEGRKETLSPVDQVVIAVGLRARDELKETLREKGIRHFIVGDARKARRIIEATEEGARAAWEV
ncbi:FAD-dependent oxidoreductase, partial [Thermodesulfobacteriota bacterium]